MNKILEHVINFHYDPPTKDLRLAGPHCELGELREEHAMKTSDDHILTTHTGSLPRPEPLIDLVYSKQEGKTIDDAAFASLVGKTVDEVVRRQADIGIDVVSDGEVSKPASSITSAIGLPGLAASGRLGRSATWMICRNCLSPSTAAPPDSTS
jgi:hypothetical protein